MNIPSIRVTEQSQLAVASAALDIQPPRPVLVLVGAAASLEPALAKRVLPLLTNILAPIIVQCDAVAIDGGTDYGVMALLGRARRSTGAAFPLLGVAATGTLAPPAGDAVKGARLNPDHSGHLLVPGSQWGDEVPWMSALATTIAGDAGSATLAIGGGAITERDLTASLASARATLMLTETGPLAERLSQQPPPGLRMIPLSQAADRLARELPLLLHPSSASRR
ncbi:hypothetical protein [Thiorhodovibrio frisius]|uniref:LSDAT prokaryote domain-containing protein n=1 Tax=Thiorhodovibrio frisius TaxID=631362 RepID=H8YWL8_9GAMM|nr:hypothetical protein [Thiorhodovibrio frisius]EIC22844.1 hypothetical protein Thi970DRAFT_00480 [Thiorhodovibrio frisius]WPL22899.1 hypothetical protein Thiofri_03077 [Thiorhodovibrio frisius]